jgi:hypothetical protein
LPSFEQGISQNLARSKGYGPDRVKFIGNLYRADANFGTALAKAAGVELESGMKLIAKK